MSRTGWKRLQQLTRCVAGWDWFWWIAGVAGILAIGICLSWRFWEDLHGDEESLSTTVRNLGLVIGGVIAILLAVWRSHVAARQADTAQRGLLNERYQKGAEMLGNDVLSVRLGGIFTLDCLAIEHPEQYHIQIMKLFCAFVRHPTAYDCIEVKQDDVETEPNIEEKQRDLNPQLREDVQAVITCIGTREEAGLALERKANFVLDLNGAGLSWAQLSGANLARADLSHANLRHSNFFSTRLQAADLSEPFPSGPNQPQARLQIRTEMTSAMSKTIDFSSVHGLRANLSRARLQGANLSGAVLPGADLSGALLLKANLSKAFLSHVNLFKAVLIGADLSKAFLLSANLSGAQLAQGNLSGAILSDAKLYGANLFLASLQGADLSGAVLVKADAQYLATGITQEQLDLRCTDFGGQ